jgi:hypothetical protein
LAKTTFLALANTNDDSSAITDLSSHRQDKGRITLLHRVYTTWIEGVLKHSLQQVPFLHLGLEEYPSGLANPWAKEVQETNLPSSVLPDGTTLMQAYEQAGGKLLLLGEPGAGKTTLLLELVRFLLLRAETDDSIRIPVVFNLSSWAVKRSSLDDWLVEELRTKYRMPRKTGQAWIENDNLALFLDGLDEVAEEARPACVKAIQTYQNAHARVPLVVSCRRGDYFALDARVSLQKAVLIRSLTRAQIDQYLTTADGQLEAARKALQDDVELENMCTNPLMLNIVCVTYWIGEHDNTPLELSGSRDNRRKQILHAYIQKALGRRAAPGYTPEETIARLTFLAKQMKTHNQSVFYLERVQPDWTEDRSLYQYRLLVNRVVISITVFLFAALLACFRGDFVPHDKGLFYWLGGGQGDSVLGWMSRGMAAGLPGAISLSLLFALVAILVNLLGDRKRIPTFTVKALRRALLIGLRWGIVSAACIGTIAMVVFSEEHFTCLGGSLSGVSACGGSLGIFGGIIVGFQIALIALFKHDTKFLKGEKKKKTFFTLKDRLINMLIFGVWGYIGFALIYALQSGQINSLILTYSLIPGAYFGIMYHQGFETGLGPELGITIQLAETAVWSWKEVRLHFLDNLKKGASLAGILLVSVVFTIMSVSSLFYGLPYGFHYGLIFGVMVALISGLTGMFMGMLTSGWSNDMLDEREFARPNEGTRRSIRNAVFAACLFGTLGGLASGLVSALAFALGGIAGWLTVGTGLAIIFTIGCSYEIFMLYGGTALVEHYTLRWFLWRKRQLPWDCIPFLDYAVERILMRKVGGGYMFIHRLLLEHFAEEEATSRKPKDKENGYAQKH